MLRYNTYILYKVFFKSFSNSILITEYYSIHRLHISIIEKELEVIKIKSKILIEPSKILNEQYSRI